MFQKYTVIVLFYFYFNVLLCKGIDYGTLNIIINKVDTCQGPKRLYCTIEKFNQAKKHSFMYRVVVKENFHVTNWIMIGTQNGQELIRYQVRKPCENLFIKSLLKAYLNISESCIASKGEYEFVVDIQAISQTYYNGIYMYGNWTFKTVIYGNNCNFVCNLVDVSLLPKNKS